MGKFFQGTTMIQVLDLYEADIDPRQGGVFATEFASLTADMAFHYPVETEIVITDVEQSGILITSLWSEWSLVKEGSSDGGDWKLESMLDNDSKPVGWALSIAGSPGSSALTTFFMVM